MRAVKRGRLALGLAGALLLAACGDDEPVAWDQRPVPPRDFPEERVELGRTLFQQHCATCHGAGAEGDPNWRYRDEQGMFPPPPLNGTAHAWHHPWSELRDIIQHGSRPGEGRMPAWNDVLSEEEIDSIIMWFITLWPDEVYAAWHEIDQRARARGETGRRH
ncbi:cytochrome c [Ectothiorhodospiraceae bacterium 2226]|nr:cytochrome c [Ectothiorhodospiraceae bacterium 2226]